MEGVWANVDLGKNRALVRAKQELTREALATALSENSYTLSEYKKTS